MTPTQSAVARPSDADRGAAGHLAPGHSSPWPAAMSGEVAVLVPAPSPGGSVLPRLGSRHSLGALRADPRLAIQENIIRCLVCGGVFRQLTNTHLRGHATSAAEYKRRFGYNRGRPLMCRALQRLYAERAVKTGLAARIRHRPILVEPELRRRGGAREIALEELLTRREVRRRARPASGVV